MNNFARMLWIIVVATTLLPVVALADDDPDFRTIVAPYVVYVCESPDLLKRLNLTGEQKAKLKEILDKWKPEFLAEKRKLDSRPEDKKRRYSSAPRRDDRLKNVISDLLDDQQHQLFHQMLYLWLRSPVQSRYAFQFDLGVSDEQHIQLKGLETQWISRALKEVTCDYRYPRHTEVRDYRGLRKLIVYGTAITRLEWDFKAERNAEWKKILTPKQARRWKERELQLALKTNSLNRFVILVVDFSSFRLGPNHIPSGTSLGVLPYYIPPSEALKWSDEQLPKVRALAESVRWDFADAPSDREERASWMKAQREREIKCMRQIEEVMTAEQRATWWGLIGEPDAKDNFLRELKANSLSETKSRETESTPDRDER